MGHHDRWLNRPSSLLKELGRKSRIKANELRSGSDDNAEDGVDVHLASDGTHLGSNLKEIDIQARADDGIPPQPPPSVPGQEEPNPETNPDPNPQPSPESPESDPTVIEPKPETTVVATIIHIVLSGGSSTIAEFTVPTLPAVVSNTALGVITIPAQTDSPITIPSQHNHAAEPTDNPALPPPVPVAPISTGVAPEPSTVPAVIGATQALSSEEPSESSEPSATVEEVATSTSTSTTDTDTDTEIETETETAADDDTSTSLSSDQSVTTSTSQTDINVTLSTTSNPSASTSTGSDFSSGTDSENTVLVGAPAPAPTSTDSSDTEASSSSDGGFTTPKLAGAVVGSIAGLILVLLLILFLIRRRKRHVREIKGTILSDGPGEITIRSPSPAPPRPPRPMTQSLGSTPFAAGLFNRWTQSTQSDTTVETSPSERGFQNLGGRKIPSVLYSGGDGYGGGFDKETGGGGGGYEAESSVFHKETSGFVAGATINRPGAHRRPDPSQHGVPLEHSESMESDTSEVAVMRPGPARMATTARNVVNSQTGYSTPTISAQSSHHGEPMPPTLLARPGMDAVGRSLHSFDGSRGSRGSRFKEGV